MTLDEAIRIWERVDAERLDWFGGEPSTITVYTRGSRPGKRSYVRVRRHEVYEDGSTRMLDSSAADFIAEVCDWAINGEVDFESIQHVNLATVEC